MDRKLSYGTNAHSVTVNPVNNQIFVPIENPNRSAERYPDVFRCSPTPAEETDDKEIQVSRWHASAHSREQKTIHLGRCDPGIDQRVSHGPIVSSIYTIM